MNGVCTLKKKSSFPRQRASLLFVLLGPPPTALGAQPFLLARWGGNGEVRMHSGQEIWRSSINLFIYCKRPQLQLGLRPIPIHS